MSQIVDSRQAAILTALLTTSQAVAANVLATRLGLSERELRYVLPQVKAWLKEHGASLSARPYYGLLVETSDSKRKALLAEVQTGPVALLLTPEDRLHLLLFELLSNPDGSKTSELEVILSVRTATLNRDLRLAKEWLVNRRLQLKPRGRNGISVTGDERDYRHALAELLVEIGLEKDIKNFCQWGSARSVPVNLFYSITVRVFEKISTWPLPVAWRYIALLQRELQVQFSENDILGLTLYLGITLQRVNKNRTAVIAEDLTQAVQCLDEFPVISNLMRRLKQERGTLLSPEEQALFTIEVRERICRP